MKLQSFLHFITKSSQHTPPYKYISRKLTFSAFQRYMGLGVWNRVILSKNSSARHRALLTFLHLKTPFVNEFFIILPTPSYQILHRFYVRLSKPTAQTPFLPWLMMNRPSFLSPLSGVAIPPEIHAPGAPTTLADATPPPLSNIPLQQQGSGVSSLTNALTAALASMHNNRDIDPTPQNGEHQFPDFSSPTT